MAAKGVADPLVLAAMAEIPRELFLPEPERWRAYEDRALPLGWGQTCSQPLMVAWVVQALQLGSGGSVLEVGAGSGYLAAVMIAAGARSVLTVELIPELAELARRNLTRAGIRGVEVLIGDGGRGVPERAPFDRVVVSATAPRVPPALLQQLTLGGRLVCPVNRASEERLIVMSRDTSGWTTVDLGPCRFVPLRGSEAPGREAGQREGDA